MANTAKDHLRLVTEDSKAARIRAIVEEALQGQELLPVQRERLEELLADPCTGYGITLKATDKGSSAEMYAGHLIAMFRTNPALQKRIVAGLLEEGIIEQLGEGEYNTRQDRLLLALFILDAEFQREGVLPSHLSWDDTMFEEDLKKDERYASALGTRARLDNEFIESKGRLEQILKERIEADSIETDVYRNLERDPLIFFRKLNNDIGEVQAEIDERKSELRGLGASLPDREDLRHKVERRVALLTTIEKELIDLQADLGQRIDRLQGEKWRQDAMGRTEIREESMDTLFIAMESIIQKIGDQKRTEPVSVSDKTVWKIMDILEPILGAIKDVKAMKEATERTRINLRSLDGVKKLTSVDKWANRERKDYIEHDLRVSVGGDAVEIARNVDTIARRQSENEREVRSAHYGAKNAKLRTLLTKMFQLRPDFVRALNEKGFLRYEGVTIVGDQLMFDDGQIVDITTQTGEKVSAATELGSLV